MKTNQLTPNRISILITLIAITFFPFISTAQLYVNTSNNVGIGVSAPTRTLDAQGTNPVIQSAISSGTTSYAGVFMQDLTSSRNLIQLIGGTARTGTLFGITNASTAQIYTNNAPLVIGTAQGSDVTIGTNSLANVTFQSGGKVGIGTPSPTALLSVNGAADKAGGGTWGTFCDIRLKKDTSAFRDGLAVIKKIHPINFRYNGRMGIKDTNSTFVGVVAQQIQQVAPYTVQTFMAKLDIADTQETQLLTYNPNALFYLFVNAFKELDSVNVKKDSVINSLLAKTHLQDSINSSLQNKLITNNTLLQDQLNQLMTTINNCCNRSQSLIDNGNNGNTKSMSINNTDAMRIDVKLNDIQTVILEQNVPNPFAEQTTINYSLNDNTVKAQMLFYNAQGKLIQSTELSQKGKGSLNVFASDLSSGVYTYTLVVDGKIIETKRMVKQ